MCEGANQATTDGCPRCLAVKFEDILYSLSPDILYTLKVQLL